MRTNVHQNSIDAYRGDLMRSDTIKGFIHYYSALVPRFTVRMVSAAYNKNIPYQQHKPPSTFGCWVKKLEAEGILVEDKVKSECEESNNTATYFYNPLTYKQR